jgi:hypothetical protein
MWPVPELLGESRHDSRARLWYHELPRLNRGSVWKDGRVLSLAFNIESALVVRFSGVDARNDGPH